MRLAENKEVIQKNQQRVAREVVKNGKAVDTVIISHYKATTDLSLMLQ
jgi:hypothetical protein